MINQRHFGFRHNYTSVNRPLYRGLDPFKTIQRDEYCLGSVNMWPIFTAATSSRDRAIRFSRETQSSFSGGDKIDTFDRDILLFEIFSTNQNQTATTIDLSKGDFAHYTGVHEVLLMPMFSF